MWRDMEAIFGVFHVSMFKFDMVHSYGELYEFIWLGMNLDMATRSILDHSDDEE